MDEQICKCLIRGKNRDGYEKLARDAPGARRSRSSSVTFSGRVPSMELHTANTTKRMEDQ
jgi:hypothetical protein